MLSDENEKRIRRKKVTRLVPGLLSKQAADREIDLGSCG